jgi:hypothetical protein
MAEIQTYARPLRLYRYRSLRSQEVNGRHRIDPQALDRELRAIEEGYIFCPKFVNMNDPMEGLYRASGRLQGRPDYHAIQELLFGEKVRTGIASLCEAWDNELMWAHYADGFRGICVSYSFEKLLRGLPESSALSRIAYGDKPYHLHSAAFRQEDRARAILSTKSRRWSYEREWRLFAEETGRTHFDTDAVSSVYLGARMADEDRPLVRRRLESMGVAMRETLVDGFTIKRTGRRKSTGE